MPIRFDVLTLFPGLFDGFLRESLLAKAVASGAVEIHRWDFREWTLDKHAKVDDRPYGGGAGMVIGCQPVFDCVEAVTKLGGPGELIALSPQGERLTQRIVEDLASKPRILLLCGRYEGFDERIYEGLKPRLLSIGDFICNGGEVPAMVVIDAVARLMPGVLGDERSAAEDSFSRPDWMEYPQYTRPETFRGMKVPPVLLGGDHGAIDRWREEESRRRSERKRRKGTDDDPSIDGEG
jgi:tRNA (guanine37-N1)-methyltransferase